MQRDLITLSENLKKSQRFFAQDPKFITKLKWKENWSPNFSYRHRESSFEELAQKLLPEGCKDFNVQKWWKKNTFFHKRMILLKLFGWRRRMQFWEPRQWTFDKKAGFFPSMSKNDIETIFRGKILHKFILWTLGKQCLQPSRGNLPESWNIYHQRPTVMKKHFSQKET